MYRKLRFHPKVKDDIQLAADWYDGKADGLSARFCEAVDEQFNKVANSPEIFGWLFRDLEVRVTKVRKFPYLVLYRHRRNATKVLAVLHTASDPRKWRHRLSEP